MTTTTEQAPKVESKRPRKPRKREAPNDSSTRWMLWMPNGLLAALAAEKERTGAAMAQYVVQGTAALMALTPEERDAYAREAERLGVPVPEVYSAAISRGRAQLGQ